MEDIVFNFDELLEDEKIPFLTGDTAFLLLAVRPGLVELARASEDLAYGLGTAAAIPQTVDGSVALAASCALSSKSI